MSDRTSLAGMSGDAMTITITPAHPTLSIGCHIVGPSTWGTNILAGAVWPAANRAIFFPFVVPRPVTAMRMFWRNQAVVSGNVDTGIYDTNGNRIVSKGSTAQVTINTNQTVDTTDVDLEPGGRYYAAMAMDNATGTVLRWAHTNAAVTRACGIFQMAAAFPLPDPVTFAAATSAFIPDFGLSARALF